MRSSIYFLIGLFLLLGVSRCSSTSPTKDQSLVSSDPDNLEHQEQLDKVAIELVTSHAREGARQQIM
jgi:hypothetical protein